MYEDMLALYVCSINATPRQKWECTELLVGIFFCHRPPHAAEVAGAGAVVFQRPAPPVDGVAAQAVRDPCTLPPHFCLSVPQKM